MSEFIIYVHGGLRGAVGLAFALLANADESLTPGLRDIVNYLELFLIFEKNII